jgi:RHS repeat-associated protein
MAAMRLGGEKPHQGVLGKNPALNQGHEVCNFTVLLGLRGQAELNRVGPRSTGKERDTESGLDNFGARFHGSTLGRFMSPDSLQPSRSHPLVLLQFLADPQNWNKYAYALNNPVKDTDLGGHFTGDDHEKMQMNAMLANGYSQSSAKIAATADRRMDNWRNVAGGVALLHYIFSSKDNPQHGERADGQSREDAQRVADNFMSSKIKDAASRALQGDVQGALTDLGQASHTAQDIVRHDFESSSQHGWSERPATAAEEQAANAATQNVLNEFGDQLFRQASQQGLSMDQMMNDYRLVLGGRPQGSVGSPDSSSGGQGSDGSQ